MNSDDPLRKEAERLLKDSRAVIEQLEMLLAKAAPKPPPDGPDAPTVVDSEPKPPAS